MAECEESCKVFWPKIPTFFLRKIHNIISAVQLRSVLASIQLANWISSTSTHFSIMENFYCPIFFVDWNILLLKKLNDIYKFGPFLWLFNVVICFLIQSIPIPVNPYTINTKIMIFEKNYDFPKKWWFSKKMIIFQKNYDCPKKLWFSKKNMIFQKNYDFPKKTMNRYGFFCNFFCNDL